MKFITKNKRGYITLISILVIGAIGISVSVSLLLLGLSSSRTSFTFQKAREAEYLAHACVEEALMQIREDILFEAYVVHQIAGKECSYSVKNIGGEKRYIASYSIIDKIERKVEVYVDKINPEINIVSWQEVADF